MVGLQVSHPLDGRPLPIIADDLLVKMEFGTGAVKITPAHDPNDFAAGTRAKLPFVNLLTDDGKLNANGGRFAGMPRFEAGACCGGFLLHLFDACKSKGSEGT